ncbi:MAG TPA: hypothetical protein VGO56_10145 [Pyrinomonadaceae bacterium]|jgi:hypothetical protein|nr:hypothetical protein [Pyrinomonadaceae bacterium]
MKKIVLTSLFVLFLVGGPTAPSASAQTGGPSASGSYRFTLEDALTKQVEFSARLDERGTATGQMTFRDEAGAVEVDVDGEGGHAEESHGAFFMTANLNSLTIDRNRAVMAGTVTNSSNPGYVGRWVQLVVEDNGDGSQEPDRLTWCFCKPEQGGWVPSDAEVRGDEGAWWRWWATDAERRDDVGVQSENIIPGSRTSCRVLPLAAYPFEEIRGEGQIQVQR